MAEFYVYLIASLPMLHFGARSPFSYAQFLKRCDQLVPEEALTVLAAIPDVENDPSAPVAHGTLLAWRSFDIMLRNELVRTRAAARKIDPAPYLRQDGYADPWIAHLVHTARRNPAIIDAERALDHERWRYLDELTVGHYFDLDALIVYALKLLILERWEKITRADTPGLIEAAAG